MHLPPEITDRILDFLHTDRIALENCSLVCRSWVSCCRFHTIHRLSLPPHRQQKFLPFSTHIGRYVRDLIIHNQYDQVTDAICSQLVNLDSLAIINCHIPELDLHKYQALWSIPSIKSLRIIVCHYETIPPDSDGRVGSSNIESLVFYHVSGAGSFISWACGLDLFPRVRTFHYCAEYPHVGSGDDMNWLKSLCETCGPNLVDVKFQNIPALCSDSESLMMLVFTVMIIFQSSSSHWVSSKVFKSWKFPSTGTYTEMATMLGHSILFPLL